MPKHFFTGRHLFLTAVLASGLAGHGCAHRKIIRQAADLRQEKVWVSPRLDSSGISDRANFPKGEPLRKMLLARWDEIQERFYREAQKYASLGQYEVVGDSLAATVVLQLRFLPAEMKGPDLNLPCAVILRKIKEPKETRHSFTVASRPPSPGPLDSYHLWGELLAGIKRNFPFSELSELFYDAENAPPAP
jgi:hypothetical protein